MVKETRGQDKGRTKDSQLTARAVKRCDEERDA